MNKHFKRTNYPNSITFTPSEEAKIAAADVVVVQSATEDKVIAYLYPAHILRDGKQIPQTDRAGEFKGMSYYKVYNF